MDTPFIKCCIAGDLDGILKMEEDYFESICEGVYEACRYGHINIVKHFIKHVELHGNIFLAGEIAYRHNYMNIIGVIADNDGYQLYHLLNVACEDDNMDALKYIIDKAKTIENIFWSITWDTVLEWASCKGRFELMEFAISNGANNWIGAFDYACMGGHVAMIDKILVYATRNNTRVHAATGLAYICDRCHLDAAKYLIAIMGNASLETILADTLRNRIFNHKKVMFILDLTATKYTHMLTREHIIELLNEYPLKFEYLRFTCSNQRAVFDELHDIRVAQFDAVYVYLPKELVNMVTFLVGYESFSTQPP